MKKIFLFLILSLLVSQSSTASLKAGLDETTSAKSDTLNLKSSQTFLQLENDKIKCVGFTKNASVEFKSKVLINTGFETCDENKPLTAQVVSMVTQGKTGVETAAVSHLGAAAAGCAFGAIGAGLGSVVGIFVDKVFPDLENVVPEPFHSIGIRNSATVLSAATATGMKALEAGLGSYFLMDPSGHGISALAGSAVCSAGIAYVFISLED